jgi:hypothetical protein
MMPIVFWASLAPVAEAERGGRRQLAVAEPPVQSLDAPVAVEHPEDDQREDQAHGQADQRGQHDELERAQPNFSLQQATDTAIRSDTRASVTTE